MICNAGEWDMLPVDDRFQNEQDTDSSYLVSELSTEMMDMLDRPGDSAYGDTVPLLDYSDYHLGVNSSTVLQGILNASLPYPELQDDLGRKMYRQPDHDIYSQSQDRPSRRTTQDTFDTSFLALDYFDQDKNGNNGQEQEKFEEPSTTARKPGEISPSKSPISTQDFSRKRPLRRQNHACDTCRSSKKACDLPLDVSVSHGYKVSRECTTCKIRGVECRAEWLSKKQSLKQAKKRAKLAQQSALDTDSANHDQKLAIQTTVGIPTPTSTTETELARQFMAQLTCSEYFHLYVQSFDMPVTQCLISGSMLPRYSLGVGGYIPLCRSPQISAHIQRANSWIETCWPVSISNHAPPTSLVSTPHLFSALSVLDALFFSASGTQKESQSKSCRDVLITDTYKQVAVATAAQFVLSKVKNPNCESKTNIRAENVAGLRDVAHAAWCKARDMLFRNISATRSFRLATSLVLFGLIFPTVSSSEDRQMCEEDSRYALQEGLTRLRSLSSQARCRLEAVQYVNEFRDLTQSQIIEPLQSLSLNDRANVLELVGAMEWMVSLINSIIIGTSRGTICPLAFDDYDAEDKMQDNRILDSRQSSEECESEIDGFILTRTEERSKSPAICQELGDDNAMIHAGRATSSVSILLWRSMARFTIAAETHDYETVLRWYITTTSLINIWRNTFGSLDANTRLSFHQPGCRRIFAFYSNDGDLAILLFHEAAQKLAARLSTDPTSPAEQQLVNTLRRARAYHKKQRLMSAIMVSVIAASYNDVSPTESETPIADFDNIALHPVCLPLSLLCIANFRHHTDQGY